MSNQQANVCVHGAGSNYCATRYSNTDIWSSLSAHVEPSNCLNDRIVCINKSSSHHAMIYKRTQTCHVSGCGQWIQNTVIFLHTSLGKLIIPLPQLYSCWRFNQSLVVWRAIPNVIQIWSLISMESASSLHTSFPKLLWSKQTCAYLEIVPDSKLSTSRTASF